MEQKCLGKIVLRLSLYSMRIVSSWQKVGSHVESYWRKGWCKKAGWGWDCWQNWISSPWVAVQGICSPAAAAKKKLFKECNLLKRCNLRDDIWATVMCLQEQCNQQRFILETWWGWGWLQLLVLNGQKIAMAVTRATAKTRGQPILHVCILYIPPFSH